MLRFESVAGCGGGVWARGAERRPGAGMGDVEGQASGGAGEDWVMGVGELLAG